ncbi:MAG: hypothetical protein H7239_08065 [Flavobacterium sp.]|nr:hypothetical protein [Flavobacterium sp.]
MPVNQNLINKGIKYLFIALPQMFIGPAVMYNAFMNKQTNWHYLVLFIGIGLCLSGVYFAFQGINTIVKGLFNDEK